jgi:hypothetical protein
VGDVAITVPIGFGLDENGADAIRKAVWKPAMKGGEPVTTVLDLYINFRIFSKRTAPIAGKKGEEATVEIAPPKPKAQPGPYTLVRSYNQGQVAPALPTPDQAVQPTQTTQSAVPTTGTGTTQPTVVDSTATPTSAIPTSTSPAVAQPQPAQTTQGAMPTQETTTNSTKPAANKSVAPTTALPSLPDANKPASTDFKAPASAITNQPATTTKPTATDWQAPTDVTKPDATKPDATKPADATTQTPAADTTPKN